jgi:hypothetical protein
VRLSYRVEDTMRSLTLATIPLAAFDYRLATVRPWNGSSTGI